MPGACRALGEIDRATAAALGAVLRDAIDRSDDAFVSVDGSGVTFIDSAGYHVLVDATNYAVRGGHTLVVRDQSHTCAMSLRVCDLHRVLRVDPLITTQATAPCVDSRPRVGAQPCVGAP